MLVLDAQDRDEHADREEVGVGEEAPVEHRVPGRGERALGSGNDERREELAEHADDEQETAGPTRRPVAGAASARRARATRAEREHGEERVERDLDRQ